MASRQRPIDRGRSRASHLLVELGRELRDARVAAGLSQRAVASAAAMHPSQISRLERALVANATHRSYAVVFSVLGLLLGVRPFPDGDPVRDEAQVRLLERFKTILPPGAHLRMEVPLGIPAIGGHEMRPLTLGGERCPVEPETTIRDLQATDRRMAQKMNDARIARVILLVWDTAANRIVLRAHRDRLRGRYPLDGRAILRALRAGRVPDTSGILLR